MYAACMLMLAGRPLVMEEAVRNYSRRKVQRQPQCRAFFRSDAPTRPPDRGGGRKRAVDEFALAGPPNKSVRIGFVRKSPPSFSPPGKSKRQDNANAISSEEPILNLLARQNAPNVKRDHKKRSSSLKRRGRIIEPRQGAAFDSGGRTV